MKQGRFSEEQKFETLREAHSGGPQRAEPDSQRGERKTVVSPSNRRWAVKDVVEKGLGTAA